MSKFLKVVVNLFLICAILIAGAILVPPLLGISTTIIDSASMDTNLPIGSVTYSQDVMVTDISVGDKILYETDAKVYAYIVESADAGSGSYIGSNPEDGQADPVELTLRSKALKVVLTIPFIGYVMIAMRSMEGMIIIGLVVLFIIILFILSELWKDTEDDDEDECDMEEEEQGSSGSDEHIRVAEQEEKQPVYSGTAEELTMDELARSIAEIQKEKETEAMVEKPEQPEIQAEGSAAEAVSIAEEPVMEEVQQCEPDGFVPVPRLTKEEILKKAKVAGDDPEVIEYKELGITIIDFSKDL